MKKIYTTLIVFAIAISIAYSQSKEPIVQSGKKDKNSDSFIVKNEKIVKLYQFNSNQLSPEDIIF